MIYDLIIIGAGPAGITAAIYANRQKLKTLVISKNIGGQIAEKTVDIENYPGFEKISGMELVNLFKKQLKNSGADFLIGEVTSIKKENKDFIVLVSKEKKYESKSVIIATGSDPRPLEVSGEKEFIGRGVSYCVLCDGPLFKNKTVAIIGGGNAGFEAALFLSNYVKKIFILEFGEKPRASEYNQELVKKNGKTEIITLAQVLKIKGNNFVESLVYQDLKENKEKELPVDGIFIEVGRVPATAFAKDLVDFSQLDEIIVVPETCETKTPGLFAAGDCNQGKYKQIITAAGEGAKSALAAYEYIQKISTAINS